MECDVIKRALHWGLFCGAVLACQLESDCSTCSLQPFCGAELDASICSVAITTLMVFIASLLGEKELMCTKSVDSKPLTDHDHLRQ